MKRKNSEVSSRDRKQKWGHGMKDEVLMNEKAGRRAGGARGGESHPWESPSHPWTSKSKPAQKLTKEGQIRLCWPTPVGEEALPSQ